MSWVQANLNYTIILKKNIALTFNIINLKEYLYEYVSRIVVVIYKCFINIYISSVINIQAKEKVKPRPVALNTVELMRVASAGLGMGPHHAMQVIMANTACSFIIIFIWDWDLLDCKLLWFTSIFCLWSLWSLCV